ncbi:MAG: glycoside hydrolase [Rhodospirillales bacterium]|nr:glycoside hydrolase [Rhodospirillales bacterium]
MRSTAGWLAGAVLLLLAFWARGHAVFVPPMRSTAPIESLSYAPFRPGQSPLAPARWPSRAQVAADLALLAGKTRAIRTYGAIGGAYDLPALARAAGLHVWQGIWLSADAAANAREIAAGIALARAHPHTITRVIVGNEVLLRGDLTEPALAAMLDRVRAAVRQPVAYADVWEFWAKNPALAAHVDQMMVHVLPYWENHPVPADRAVAHIARVLARMAQEFPGKPIVLGETGWPSRGHWRGAAAPGRVAQTRFLRAFLDRAAAAHWDYNIIEAFDQHWKVATEGSVGTAWGLWSADRHAKFSRTGPVARDPDWPLHAALALALAALLAAFWDRPAGDRSHGRRVLLACAAGGLLVAADQALAALAFTPARLALAALALAGQAGLAITLGRAQARRLHAWLALAFLVLALAVSVPVALWPRYRDLPTPLLALAGLAALAGTVPAGPRAIRAVLAAGLGASACAIAVHGGLADRPAWLCAGLLLVLAGAGARRAA